MLHTTQLAREKTCCSSYKPDVILPICTKKASNNGDVKVADRT